MADKHRGGWGADCRAPLENPAVRARFIRGLREGLSTELVSDLVGCSYRTVKSWLTRGREVLRRFGEGEVTRESVTPYEAKCAEFAELHDAARATAAGEVLGTILAASRGGDARAAVALWDRLHAKRYGAKSDSNDEERPEAERVVVTITELAAPVAAPLLPEGNSQ